MMKFESDVFPTSNVTIIPTGSEDSLDAWYEENFPEPTEQDWADYFEAMYDPD